MSEIDGAHLIRKYFAAWMTADRAAMETYLADDFRFNSPRDEWIDRASWFQTCWPFAGTFRRHEIIAILARGRRAYVTYDGETADGSLLHNTELMEFEGDKLRSVDVFFGRPDS
ncbi:MAG: nuclear transport factor 2 family protein [Janthinobacterium lividum]